MAFMVSSNGKPTSSNVADNKDVELNSYHRHEEEIITSQLHLRSSSSSAGSSSQGLDKEVVLRRIRHHKYINKVKSALQGLKGSSKPPTMAQEWLDYQGDAFSSP
ncbi:hypothetical protein ACFE04_002046 [Oxalis oulophora]